MGVLGYSYICNDTTSMKSVDIFNIFDFEICVNALYTGFSWLYTCVEFVYAYDYKITYFWFLGNIHDESFDFFFLLTDILT